jgi:hypothetical protein
MVFFDESESAWEVILNVYSSMKETQKAKDRCPNIAEKNVLNWPSGMGHIEEYRFPDIWGHSVVAILRLNESGDPYTGVTVASVCGRLAVQLATLPTVRSVYRPLIATRFIHSLHVVFQL